MLFWINEFLIVASTSAKYKEPPPYSPLFYIKWEFEIKMNLEVAELKVSSAYIADPLVPDSYLNELL